MAAKKVNKGSLVQQIAELEQEIVKPRAWQLNGEIKGSVRPENSLLSIVADVEKGSKQVPIISQEYTSTLEDLIKKRIKDNQYDDVVLYKPTIIKKNTNDIELSQEKDKTGLGEIYAEDFMKKTMNITKNSSNNDSNKVLLKELFQKVCRQLDSLTHFHFTPKPVVIEPSISVTAALPSIAFEDIGVNAESSANAAAPGDIHRKKKGRDAALVADAELTREDRNRLRLAKKNKKRKEKGLHAPTSKQLESNEIDNIFRHDKRVVSGNVVESKQVDYGNSSNFFKKLDNQVKDEVNIVAKKKRRE